jgi:hypothetical protein
MTMMTMMAKTPEKGIFQKGIKAKILEQSFPPDMMITSQS